MMPKTVARSLIERERAGEKPPAILAWWVLLNEPDAPPLLRGAARAMRLLWRLSEGRPAACRPYLTLSEAAEIWKRAVAVGKVARMAADFERLILDYVYRLGLVRTAGPCPRCGDWCDEGERICNADGSKTVLMTIDPSCDWFDCPPREEKPNAEG